MADNYPSPGQVYISQEVPPAVPPIPTAGPVISPSPPKRGFPKIFIFLGIGLILIALVFVLIKFLTSVQKGQQEIIWWGLWEEESVISPLIAEYEQKNPGVKIKYTKELLLEKIMKPFVTYIGLFYKYF